jgi:hypothetical protein
MLDTTPSNRANTDTNGSPGEQDAQNSRLGLERRMTRLLSSNSDLALRMRRLRDTFGARSMARRAIPNYAPVAQNAPRLPADRTSSASSISEISASTTSGQSGQHTATDGEAAPPPRLWSIFSGYNLADIPVLSMIPLPVLTLELRDNEFYTFDFAQRVSDDLVELMQLDPGQQGTSKMLRVILSKPMVALPPGTAGMNTTPNTTTVPLEAPPVVAPANTTTTTTTTTTAAAAKSESVRMSKMIKSFKNPLKHHIRRKKLK